MKQVNDFKDFGNTQKLIEFLCDHNELKIIDKPLDIHLEIPHLAYIEVKKKDSKALLFTHPIDKKNNKKFTIPVLMNIFGSHKRLNLLIQKQPDIIAKHIESLLNASPPKTLLAKLLKLKELYALRHIFPKIHKGTAPCQEVRQQKINLYEIPILTTWESDGGAFITMGQVYTHSLDGEKKNLGMYRLQVYDKSHLGLHWQIHKDSSHFFNDYKKANQKMPVSIALGGDPLYIWCGQAPLPIGIYELLLYGFIREKNARVVKCLTNDIYVPYDTDIVIEGWVNPNDMREEGPFGDHTGFYTPIEPYPVLEVSAITMKKNPIYPATVVGKPPLEDKYMGYLTERVFLPLLQKTAHGLLDYSMPECGVFHNLIFARIAPQYPAHAMQLMHAFWGVGQMSFVKHAIFVDEDAPNLRDYEALTRYVLNRFGLDSLLISEGICDALDHSSPNFAFGGKLGVQALGEEKTKDMNFILRSNDDLLQCLRQRFPFIHSLEQYFTDTRNPICILGVQKKDKNLKALFQSTPLGELAKNLKIVFVLDWHKNDLSNPYMLTWRITNNIDAKRDIWVDSGVVFIDASDKSKADDYEREWPKETDCTQSIIDGLRQKGLLQDIDDDFLRYYQITGFKRH